MRHVSAKTYYLTESLPYYFDSRAYVKTKIIMFYNNLNGYDYYEPISEGKKSRMNKPFVRPNFQYQTRFSWRGTPVRMVREMGQWTPVDGKFVKHKYDGLTVNVLCHNKDPKLPKDYRLCA